jgi:hypothetical protein
VAIIREPIFRFRRHLLIDGAFQKSVAFEVLGNIRDLLLQLVEASVRPVRVPWLCSPFFSQGMVYAPARDWAETVITEMSMFPTGRYDDLTDSASMALKYLRDHGWGQTAEERHDAETDAARHRPRPKAPLYPC